MTFDPHTGASLAISSRPFPFTETPLGGNNLARLLHSILTLRILDALDGGVHCKYIALSWVIIS